MYMYTYTRQLIQTLIVGEGPTQYGCGHKHLKAWSQIKGKLSKNSFLNSHTCICTLSLFLLQVCVRSCSLLSSCIQCHIEQNCPSSCDHVTIVSPSEHNSTDEGEEGKEEGREKVKKLNFIIVKIIQTACCDNYFLPFTPLPLPLSPTLSPFPPSLSHSLKDMLNHT